MKIKLTNQEILNLFNTLSELAVPLKPKLAYTLAKNREILGRVVKKLQRTEQSYFLENNQFQKYQKALQDLINRFSTDKDGKPILQRQPGNPTLQRVIPNEKMPEFVQARGVLDKEYADVLVGIDAHQREMDRLMHEETEIELRMISIHDLPSSGIPQNAMNQLFVLVEEEEEKEEKKTVLQFTKKLNEEES